MNFFKIFFITLLLTIAGVSYADNHDQKKEVLDGVKEIAKQLEDFGASAIMPLASPIGSGRGITNKLNLSIIVNNSKVPVIVDAGIGTASDAAIAMELGCDGVLINTAIAKAKNPIMMASSMKHAVVAGRKSFLAGRINFQNYASASSPTEGLI